jgi:ethanolamine utilization microcompartment shell protein EutL
MIKIMSKKTFALVSGIVGALQTAGVAIVTYLSPENATAINSSIVVAGAAVIEICTKFIKPEPETEKK